MISVVELTNVLDRLSGTIPGTGTSSTNCLLSYPVKADANIKFLCRLNVEDRMADSRDQYVLYKLLIAISGQGRCHY